MCAFDRFTRKIKADSRFNFVRDLFIITALNRLKSHIYVKNRSVQNGQIKELTAFCRINTAEVTAIMAVKNRLKSFRHKQEMNQKEFADFLGVNQSQYNRYERNTHQPTLEIAIKISDKLGVPVNAIFYIVDE
jgi:putative transcriptional regulator